MDKETLIEMDKERINENIALITEMLSVSDEVIAVSNRIYRDVENNIRNYPYRKIEDGLLMCVGSQTYNLWGYDIDVDAIVYNFTDKALFDENVKKIPYVNQFDPKTLTLNLTLVALFGSIYRPMSEDSIYHEIEHAYQWCLNKTNNPKFKVLVDNAYDYAVKILNSSNDETECNIAWAIYYANPREQDAFTHEYYVQARQSYQKFIIGETDVDERLRKYRSVVEWLESNFKNPQVEQCMKEYEAFGYTPNNILSYVKKGLPRFNNKLSHVRKLINITTNERMSIYPHPAIGESFARELADRIIKKLRNS